MLAKARQEARRTMGTHRTYRKHTYAFGKQVLALRTRAALTQTELAKQIDVHRRSIQNWETGESYPKAETLQLLIAVLLRHAAFTAGHERGEANALWASAAQDGSYPLAPFDEPWFDHVWALHSASSTAATQRPGFGAGSLPDGELPTSRAEMRRGIIDWGEGFAVPLLYGRDRELETLHQWVVDHHCRVVTVVGLGGIGKSSLAITLAHDVVTQFDVVLFRSLLNGPLLTDVLDQTIRVLSDQQALVPSRLSDKIAELVRLFRERRCLLILDNFEAILQPGVLTGPYRTGYDEYDALLHALGERQHQSCLILTSREKPGVLGPLEGRAAPVRMLHLTGMPDHACQLILEAKDIVGTAADLSTLAQLYGGNPLALQLVAEPIRELFGGDIGAFLAVGDAFFNGVGTLLDQQFARATLLEQAVLFWLAIERELVALPTLLAHLGERVPQREVLLALESLRHRMLIERGATQPAFALQPVILEYVTEQLVKTACHEIVDGQARLLHSHGLMQATAKDYVRHSQERLIATPLLERLSIAYHGTDKVEPQLLALLTSWRAQPLLEQGYAPGNAINLLRLLRGNLRGLDLSRLALRSVYLQGIDMQDARLTGGTIQDSIFTETFDALQAVAVSSTGAYWAAASRRGEVKVWSVSGLTLQYLWSAYDDNVWALAFSPDGSMLATSGSWDGTVKLWDIASGNLRWLGQHTSHTTSVAFAPKGHMLASGGSDATVRVWDLESGTHLHTLPHPDPVSGVAWSPDGHLLASSDVNGVIRLWNLTATGAATWARTLVGHTTWVDGLSFAPDGGALASASWDGTVKVWDMADGQLCETLTGHTDRVSRVAWSPDGRILASSSRDQTLWLWDVAQRSYVTALNGHTAGVVGLAFIPESSSLLSGSEDGTLRVWDVANGQCIRIIQGHTSSLSDVDWSFDSTQLVCGSADTLVTIYDLAGETLPRVLQGHTGVVLGVGWNTNGRWVASSEWDNVVRLWDSRSGACIHVLQHPNDADNFFQMVAWSPDGQRLACGTYRHGVHLFEMATDRQRWSEDSFPTCIRHVAWSPDATRVAGAGEDGTVYLWDAADGTLMARLTGHHGKVMSVAWSLDGTKLASSGSGSTGGELFVWDTQSGECVRAFAGHRRMVYAVAWGPSEDVLISGDGDGKLRWWNIPSGMCVQLCEAHQGAIQSLRRSPDGTKLASCGNDGALRLWDLHTGAYLQTMRRDRPYERMDITGLSGISEAQRVLLTALGAVDGMRERKLVSDDGVQSVESHIYSADDRQRVIRTK
jgi:WD40 repeat protein/transcriptional regulator with XRE-family HTH domain